MNGEWMEDIEAGHNSTFCPLPTVYFSQVGVDVAQKRSNRNSS